MTDFQFRLGLFWLTASASICGWSIAVQQWLVALLMGACAVAVAVTLAVKR